MVSPAVKPFFSVELTAFSASSVISSDPSESQTSDDDCGWKRQTHCHMTSSDWTSVNFSYGVCLNQSADACHVHTTAWSFPPQLNNYDELRVSWIVKQFTVSSWLHFHHTAAAGFSYRNRFKPTKQFWSVFQNRHILLFSSMVSKTNLRTHECFQPRVCSLDADLAELV